MIFSKQLLGSELKITINSKNIDNKIVDRCFNTVLEFENKYSRFIKGNFLYNLNKNKNSHVDGEFLSIINLTKKVSDLTEGYFDITVLPLLENIGYGLEKEKLKENIGYKNIKIFDNNIILENGISIDLGSVGKGYLVDKIYNILDLNYDDFIINFGGDIRVKQSLNILLEDPLDDKKYIGKVNIKNLSISSSTPFKRKTKKGHHLINSINKKSQDDKLAIYVSHKLATFSDVFSTALFVTPIDKSFEIIKKINGLEVMIISRNGEIFKTKGFDIDLNTK